MNTIAETQNGTVTVNPESPKHPEATPGREGGWTLAEIGFGLIVAAGLAAVALAAGTAILEGNRTQQAIQEVNNAVTAAQSYRAVTGDYDGISVEELVDKGFVLPGFTDDGVGENVYGQDLTIASANSDKDANIDYGTDSAEACAQLLLRITDQPFITGTAPSCSTAHALDFTVE
ncbi:MAG: hypothetical protein OXI19_05325 [Gemmatimonadota bacterium]|nr:hypothetical protein [Gemmatimonadota bacterium]